MNERAKYCDFSRKNEKNFNKTGGQPCKSYLCSALSLIMTDKQTLISRVEDALTSIRPHLQVDGGDVELVEITDDMHVRIKWLGMCESCNMSAFTLRAGIQEAIRANVPEVVSVEAINGV
ncbi:MAG: hypothetical protein RL013_1903 [Bacteroidota bacterium]|jgi:Fe-S cluster biogenesis protein NfuA